MNVMEAFPFALMTAGPIIIITIVTAMTPCCRDVKEMHILLPCNEPKTKG